MAINKDEVYVCHADKEVLFVGTKEECQAYKDSQLYTGHWTVSSLDGFAKECYEEGREDGLTGF